MMAKMFYTLEETKTALGKGEEEIKQYAREGRLREFRDGPRVMYKADQVDQLKADVAGDGGGSGLSSGLSSGLGGSGLAGSGLGTSDTGAGISLADTGGSGSISLADTDFGKSPGAGMVKEDTALAADLGLSGSMGGVPSPTRGGGTGTGLSGTSAGKSGITVFDVDDSNRVDPSAQTAIGSGIHDQVNLEGVGSGSGLLDLTRESDDTSLGAELLDEISPSPSAGRRSAVSDSGMEMASLSSPRGGGGGARGIAAPIYIEANDPLAPAFGWLALFGALLMVGVGFVVANAIYNVQPKFVTQMSGKPADGKAWFYLLAAVIAGLIFFIIGWLLGRVNSATPRR